MHKVTLIITALFLLTECLVGCGDDNKMTGPDDNTEPEDTSAIPNELQGEWVLESATINGIAIPLERLLSWSVKVETARLTIGVNGTHLYQELSTLGEVLWSAQGTFVVEDSVFFMDIEFSILGTGFWDVADEVLILSTATEAGYRLKVTAAREGHAGEAQVK